MRAGVVGVGKSMKGGGYKYGGGVEGPLRCIYTTAGATANNPRTSCMMVLASLEAIWAMNPPEEEPKMLERDRDILVWSFELEKGVRISCR